jgi:hypothetical protein
MSVELYWDDDAQTVFLLEVTGKWTWTQLHEAINKMKKVSATRQQQMGAIIDLTSGLQMPDGGLFSREGLSQFQQLLQMESGDSGPVVIVGMNPLVKNILDTVTSLNLSSVRNIFFASHMEEAQTKIYGLMRQREKA